jgi:diadenosine tetraphosphate (Ap4A) HIT family hydrolase
VFHRDPLRRPADGASSHIALTPPIRVRVDRSPMSVAAGRLFAVAAKLALEKGIAETGFRLVTNAGPDPNQEAFHLHLHCLGERNLGWA